MLAGGRQTSNSEHRNGEQQRLRHKPGMFAADFVHGENAVYVPLPERRIARSNRACVSVRERTFPSNIRHKQHIANDI